MRPSAQPFLGKLVLFAWEWKIISISKAEHLTSFWYRGRWNSIIAFIPVVARFGSLYVSGKLPAYPSPKPTLIFTSHLGQNVDLGEGYVGRPQPTPFKTASPPPRVFTRVIACLPVEHLPRRIQLITICQHFGECYWHLDLKINASAYRQHLKSHFWWTSATCLRGRYYMRAKAPLFPVTF